MNTTRRYAFALSLVVSGAAALGGCYKGQYQDTLSDLESANSMLEERESTLDSRNTSLADANERIAELEAQRSDVSSELATCERALRGSIRETDELTRRLADSQNQLLAMNERISSARNLSASQRAELEAARAEQEQLLAEVNRLRQLADERQNTYNELIGRFQSMIDAGQLDVIIKNGKIVINLPQDILFPSASARVSREGEETLGEVGSVLADFRDRTFQVEGHTDNIPISTARFPSNWDLSAARALAVVSLLQDAGVPPENLSGAGYGEYQPVAPNDSRENRALNRRIEIVMLPNIEELVPTEVE